jgi:CRP-like cAMP-binding protein
VNIANSPFARKLGAFVALSEPEMTVLSNLYRRRRSFAAGADLMREGQTEQVAYVLAEGWVVCYKLLMDGTR